MQSYFNWKKWQNTWFWILPPPPPNKIFTSSICISDKTLPVGPTFNLIYDGGLYFNKYNMQSTNNKIPKYHPEQKVYIKLYPTKQIHTEIVTVPLDESNVYTVQYNTGEIHQIHEKFTMTLADATTKIFDKFPPNLPKWIRHSAKTTITRQTTSQWPSLAIHPIQSTSNQYNKFSTSGPNIPRPCTLLENMANSTIYAI